MSNTTLKNFWQVLFLASVVVFTCGLSVTRTVVIESLPAGATVTFDGKPMGTTPLTLTKFVFKTDVAIQVEVARENYLPQRRTVTHAEAKTAVKSASVPWRHTFTLVEVRREVLAEITSNIEGSSVTLDGKPIGKAPMKQALVFSRGGENAEWSTASVRVARPPHYKEDEKIIKADEAAQAAQTAVEMKLAFNLAEIRRDYLVNIKANVDKASVFVGSEKVGVAPLQHTLVFERPDGAAPWPALELRVEKEGYEYRPPGQLPEPVYARTISVEEARQGTFAVDHFLPVRFVSVPLRLYELVADKVAVVKTNVLAEVNQNEPGKPPTQVTSAKPEDPLVLSRLSPVADHPDQVVYAAPKREVRAVAGSSPAASTADEVVGANIWMSSGSAITRMTDGRQFDIDPCVSADGRWIYFSSDRLGRRNIWRMPASGKGGFTKITGDLSSIDTEPAVSPDVTKLAYTSRSPGAPATTPSYVWIANADGTLPTQMRAGRSPSWSPDGKKLAFVSPEEKIWVMDADGGNPTQLTVSESIDTFPTWTPLGKHIVYASNKAINDLKQNNYDIWIMSADGSGQTQLTANGSFDSSPAISTDGKLLYFFSNRGAQKTGEETLQIFRLELAAE